MKIKFIAAAIAAVCAQSSFALDFAATKAVQLAFEAGTAGNHVVYLTGASALRASVPGALQKICAAGTFTQFDGSDSNIKAYSCTIGSTLVPAGMAAGDKLLVGLSVSEGSFSAVISQNATNFTYDFGAGTKNAQNNQLNFNTTAFTNTSVFRKQSAGGFMDVQPTLFSNLAEALPSLNVSYTTTPVAAGQAFGVAVSPALYKALQHAQNLTTAEGGACAENNYSAACQPSISKTQYASLVSQGNAGYIADWSILGVTGGTPVNLCRRVATSGTQAASNAFFLGKGCSVGSVEPSGAAENNPGVFNIVENSGSSNVATCLYDSAAADKETKFAIGVISAENAAATTAWRFVKLDGVSLFEGVAGGKARQNAIDMKYAFHFEFQTVTRNSASAAAQGLIAALGSAISDPTLTDLTGITIAPGLNAAGEFNADKPTLIQKASTGGNSCAAATYVF
ncbi:hypothetical protein [Viridibacterium curvum]|uniref:PBP domain-containing protein n=1 Tax=Viridibacterium curvum TaxID=1101404 RepID=A0ABP9QKR5_9RHOO